MRKSFLLSIFALTILISSLSTQAAVDGTSVWSEGNYIKYDVTFDFGEFGTIESAVTVTYESLDGDNMLFDVETIVGGNTDQETVTVGKTTGQEADGNYTGFFTDTANFEVGYITANVPNTFDNLDYEVKEDTQRTYSFQDEETEIDVWILQTTENGVTYELVLSKAGGVLLEQEISGGDEGITLKANYIDGVKVNSGFLSFLDSPFSLVAFVPFMIAVGIKRRNISNTS
ncbi:MAG: hypothetical protein ACXAE3_04095 [Candidatus Kariarchaeaceae archaeon]|jgi:hypothetical protein